MKPSTRSLFWDKFQEILVNKVCQGFIVCNDCRSILTLTSSDCTNVMRNHSISCIKAKDLTPETQPRITTLFKEISQVTPQPLRFFKKKILHGAVEMSVLDSRPFNITHGKGFEEFSRQIFDAVKYFGKMIDVKELLPHRTTVRNAIRINLFYYSSYQYFILDKPRYRQFVFILS